MHALLSRFFELALGAVHRYEGTGQSIPGRWFHGPVRCTGGARGSRAPGGSRALEIRGSVAARSSQLGLPARR